MVVRLAKKERGKRRERRTGQWEEITILGLSVGREVLLPSTRGKARRATTAKWMTSRRKMKRVLRGQ
jgi:hypothetical protein